jgi:hypothetical protein
MKRLILATLTLALTLVSLPAQAGGGRASAQTFRAAAGGCSQASAQAAVGYYPARAAAPAIRYEQRVFEDVVPMTTYRTVRRTVRVPVPVVEEEAVYESYVPEAPVFQEAAPAVLYAPVQSAAATVNYGASASATAAAAPVQPAFVERAPRARAPLFGGRIFGRRSVSKSRSVVRN